MMISRSYVYLTKRLGINIPFNLQVNKRHFHLSSVNRTRMNVHVLGAGSTGCLLAFHLQQAIDKKEYGNGEQIVLQLRSPPSSTSSSDHAGKVSLTLLNNDESIQGQKHFPFETPKQNLNRPIDVLFVCTKADQTIEAIRPFLPRLIPAQGQERPSTIVLTQNGMGLDEEMVRQFGWKKTHSEDKTPDHLPYIISGINRHGTWTRNRFETVHAGKGTFLFALSPVSEKRAKRKMDINLIDSITSLSAKGSESSIQTLLWTFNLLLTPYLQSSLGAKIERESAELVIQQQQKLVANCVINPLTALHNVRNGQCGSDPTLRRWSEQIINECAEIIGARCQGSPIPNQLSLESLTKQVWDVIDLTANNWSSMVQDLQSQRGATEIDFINGTMVRWAKEIGVNAPINERLVNLVKEKVGAK